MTQPQPVQRPALPPTGVLVAGQWQAGGDGFDVLNKYELTPLCRVDQATPDQVHAAVTQAQSAARGPIPTPLERSAVLRRTADLVEADAGRFVALMVHEAGFTVQDAQGEVARSLVTLRLCAEEATRLSGEMVSFAASAGQHERLGFTVRVPVGVVCAITPFNAPLNTVIHKIAPAIAGGNAVVLKPSVLTPLTAALLCEKLLEAGWPPQLLSLLHGSETMGRLLLEQPGISFYSFTGSTRVGRAIQAGAGLRRMQLELGSISSVIVCADADLGRAASKVANASFRKAGQVCTSVQRLYVQAPVVQEMTELLRAETLRMPFGDPRQPSTKVGPLISEASARRVEAWIAEACSQGARAIVGGSRAGAVVAPTILCDVRKGMRVVDEEVFGPVVSILPFDQLDEALSGANDSPYGLAAGVFTRNLDHAWQAARQLRFGAVHINETSSSRADAMPFGGVKESGFGHEGPAYAIREVTEQRLITVTP